jgi:serine/threonine protein kinase
MESLPLPAGFEAVASLGQGASATVVHAIGPKGDFAVKIIDEDDLDESIEELILNEVYILSLLQHPHVVGLDSVARIPPFHLGIVLELCPNGTLEAHIQVHGRLRERTAAQYAAQLLSAVAHMHAMGVVHRDIKPANVLLGARLEAKLCDFGLAAVVLDDAPLGEFCGTHGFAAPEILAERPYMARPVDVWSFGATLFNMVTGKLPFVPEREEALEAFIERMREGPFVLPSTSAGLTNFIVDLLAFEAEDRPTASEAMGAVWLEKGLGSIEPPPRPLAVASCRDLPTRRPPELPRPTSLQAVQ